MGFKEQLQAAFKARDAEICRGYEDERLSVTELAEEYGITRQQIYNILRKYKVKMTYERRYEAENN